MRLSNDMDKVAPPKLFFIKMKIKLIWLLFITVLNSSIWSQQADTTIILSHLKNIVETDQPRNYKNVKVLNAVAYYINSQFKQYADSTSFQKYQVEGKEYKNVIASFGTTNKERIIIGAHYDVCDDQDGADDNASGVVGLLEIARLLHGKNLKKRIDLVAYTLEEPPFFRTDKMGSYVHANYLKENKIPVIGMICLEMIGYFDETKGSQDYPIGLLKLFYGSKGDFITVVRKINSGKFARKFTHKMKKSKLIETKSFQGPKGLVGIDFSDHLNYWKCGFNAVMITNTAFYRNKNYHETTDEIKTLNLSKMAAVIQSVYETSLTFSQQD
jgi:Zn-dependent M28 family amino/carboxypeptidase